MPNIQRFEEIDKELSREEDYKLRLRLLFLRFLEQNFEDMEFACETFQIGRTTAYEWIDRWNKEGIEGLKDRPIPGRPPKLNEEQIEHLKKELEGKNWELREVQELVLKKFNVKLGMTAIYTLLKDKIKMHHAKPYKKDYRRPDNAEEILEGRLREKFELLESYGIEIQDIAIGFLDEASPQNKANSGKVWSIDKPHMEVNTQKFKANTIGFYAIEGQNVVNFLLDSTAESITQFFKEIRRVNDGYEYIIIILDNLSAHHTAEKVALDLGILLVFLPPYSPDLNPIEFIWKSIKRMLSKEFIESEGFLRSMIVGAFIKFGNSLGFAWEWMKRFLPDRYRENILTNVNY